MLDGAAIEDIKAAAQGSKSWVKVTKKTKNSWLTYEVDLNAMTSTNTKVRTVRRLRKATMRVFRRPDLDLEPRMIKAHAASRQPNWQVVFQFEDDGGWKNIGLAANETWLTNANDGVMKFEWTHNWNNSKSGSPMTTKYNIDLVDMKQTSCEKHANSRSLRVVAITDVLAPQRAPWQ